jgi:hypothetical protein
MHGCGIPRNEVSGRRKASHQRSKQQPWPATQCDVPRHSLIRYRAFDCPEQKGEKCPDHTGCPDPKSSVASVSLRQSQTFDPRSNNYRKEKKTLVEAPAWIRPPHAKPNSHACDNRGKVQVDHALSSTIDAFVPHAPCVLISTTSQLNSRALLLRFNGHSGSGVSQLTVGGTMPVFRASAALAT